MNGTGSKRMTNLLQKFHRPKPIAWLFFIAGFGLTLALGTWQVQRLSWKEGLIAELAAANEAAPLTSLPHTEAEFAPLQFRRATLHGTWVNNVEFHLAPRYRRNKFGYAIISPLKLPDGRILLVNRGWVPGDKKLPDSRPESAVNGSAVVHGLIRVGPERSYFTPLNQPTKNIWFGRDIAEMAAEAKLDNTVPAMLDLADAEAEKAGKALPIPSDGVIRLRNDHLSYMLTWYGIAAGILVIFLVYHRKKLAR